MKLLKKLVINGMLSATLLIQGTAFAETSTDIVIPKVDDAQVFAFFNDDYPAVLNYFSSLEKQQIIEFYQQQYGEIVSQELKRKRLTLVFNKDEKRIRVVISQQNKKRQVDVIIENIN